MLHSVKDSLPSATTIALSKTGHNWAKLAQVPDLPSAMVTALGETGHFAECRRCGTRQRIFWEKIKKIFCRVPDTSPLGKGDVRRAVSVRSTFLCRVLTECPIYCTRQRTLCRQKLCRRVFAECNTRQTLCRVQTWVCRAFRALGKEPVSSSVTHVLDHYYPDLHASISYHCAEY